MNVRRSTASTRHALAYLHDTRRSRMTAPTQHPPLRCPLPANMPEPGRFGSVPLCERVADLLAEAMLAIFEALEICERERTAQRDAALLGAQIRVTYDQVNGLTSVRLKVEQNELVIDDR
jgi:hypothetical protein